MKRYGKWLCAVSIGIALTSGISIVGHATEQKLQDTKEKVSELEKKKKQADKKAEELENTKENLEGELGKLDSELTKISSSLTELEREIEEKKSSIEKTKKELEKAKEQSEKQYESMKRRIQYMYENGSQSLLAAMLSVDSLSDFINRTEYVESIAGYDREKLEEYQKLCKKIEADKAKLEKEETQLASMKKDTKKKKEQMDTLIASTKEDINRSDEELGDAKELAKSYEEEIEKQKEYEIQLELQKAKEDAARMAEIKKQEEEGANGANAQTQEGDLPLLAALIECEAGGEPYAGKLAVGSVVLNRAASSYFPNTVVGVIYQSGQFSPVASGRFATVLSRGADASCTQAAQEVLNGNITTKALYFRRNNGIIQGTVIGNHVFY